MIRLYDHKFTLAKGNKVFVPTAATARFGAKLCHWVFKRWTPPSYFYHLCEGGHVAAARNHIEDQYFLKLDLKQFFDSVTRTKVARSLKKIGFHSKDAFDLAQQSTVEKNLGERDFSLPYGFPQSTALASLALHESALGKSLEKIHSDFLSYRLSVYMDDIIISTHISISILENALNSLTIASQKSGLSFNEAKTQGPGNLITAFNIHISYRNLTITNSRMSEFETAIKSANHHQISGIINYVNSVNPVQAKILRESFLII